MEPREGRARVERIEGLVRALHHYGDPPGGLVLDPFAGSGTTGMACALESFRFLGIEQDPDFARIAEARIAYAAAQTTLPLGAELAEEEGRRE